MDASTRNAVRDRAGQQCEYCQREQADSPLIPLHIEHVIPRKHDGGDGIENLALACADCNFKKSSDLAGLDPDTGQLTPLFHPRQHPWSEHFGWIGIQIIGLTPIGRTTIRVLGLNSSERLRVRLATQSN